MDALMIIFIQNVSLNFKELVNVYNKLYFAIVVVQNVLPLDSRKYDTVFIYWFRFNTKFELSFCTLFNKQYLNQNIGYCVLTQLVSRICL